MPVLNNQVFNDQFVNRNSAVSATGDLDDLINTQEKNDSLKPFDNNQKSQIIIIKQFLLIYNY